MSGNPVADIDVFRAAYRVLTEQEKAHIAAVKECATELHLTLRSGAETNPSAREMALARTKLEECVMWAVKALTG